MTITPCPPTFLVDEGLIVPADPEAGRPEQRASNRVLRLFVAAWMIGAEESPAKALQSAKALYRYAGRDLNQPGRLSQADIEREVWTLIDIHEGASQ